MWYGDMAVYRYECALSKNVFVTRRGEWDAQAGAVKLGSLQKTGENREQRGYGALAHAAEGKQDEKQVLRDTDKVQTWSGNTQAWTGWLHFSQLIHTVTLQVRRPHSRTQCPHRPFTRTHCRDKPHTLDVWGPHAVYTHAPGQPTRRAHQLWGQADLVLSSKADIS